MTIYQDLLAGEWVGSKASHNVSPFDTGDVVGSYAESTADDAKGVIGIVTPRNFPVWNIAPALCSGNTVVFKPADLVPGGAWAIVDLLHRAGMPKELLNLVMGRGSVVGQAMQDSPDLAGITSTDSSGISKWAARTQWWFLTTPT